MSEAHIVLDNLRKLRIKGKFKEMDEYMMEVATGDFEAQTKFDLLIATYPCRKHLDLENRKKLKQHIIDAMLQESDLSEKVIEEIITKYIE